MNTANVLPNYIDFATSGAGTGGNGGAEISGTTYGTQS